jgi:YggT family protein
MRVPAPYILIIRAINFVTSIIVIGLSLRFILRLFSADPDAGFVEFIYNSTSNLLDPFRGIFSKYVIEPGSVFEFSTLFAIVMYVLAAWLLSEFILFVADTVKKRK